MCYLFTLNSSQHHGASGSSEVGSACVPKLCAKALCREQLADEAVERRIVSVRRLDHCEDAASVRGVSAGCLRHLIDLYFHQHKVSTQ